MTIIINGREFRHERELLDVTSASRPDPNWVFTDPAGHEHRWHESGVPATSFSPSKKYTLPTLVIVQDPAEYDEWGELFHPIHYECLKCRALVSPGTCADNVRQMIAGLSSYYIDGRSVSPQEFKLELDKEKAKL